MAQEESKVSESQRPADGLGFRHLAMNEIAPQQTDEASEVARRASSRLLIVVGVLAAAAAIYLAGRALVNQPPGEEAEARLRTRLMQTAHWESGVIRSTHYLSANTVRVDFSTQLSTARPEDRKLLREAARAAMEVLIQERPNRDLRIVGFQGDRQVVWADYRQKATLPGPEGKPAPELLVRVLGDPEGLASQVTGAGPRAE